MPQQPAAIPCTKTFQPQRLCYCLYHGPPPFLQQRTPCHAEAGMQGGNSSLLPGSSRSANRVADFRLHAHTQHSAPSALTGPSVDMRLRLSTADPAASMPAERGRQSPGRTGPRMPSLMMRVRLSSRTNPATGVSAHPGSVSGHPGSASSHQLTAGKVLKGQSSPEHQMQGC